MREIVFTGDLQNDAAGLEAGRIEQLGQEEAPGVLGPVARVWGIDFFVNLIVLRADESIGVPHELPEEVRTLARVDALESGHGSVKLTEERGERLDSAGTSGGVGPVREFHRQRPRSAHDIESEQALEPCKR